MKTSIFPFSGIIALIILLGQCNVGISQTCSQNCANLPTDYTAVGCENFNSGTFPASNLNSFLSWAFVGTGNQNNTFISDNVPPFGDDELKICNFGGTDVGIIETIPYHPYADPNTNQAFTTIFHSMDVFVETGQGAVIRFGGVDNNELKVEFSFFNDGTLTIFADCGCSAPCGNYCQTYVPDEWTNIQMITWPAQNKTDIYIAGNFSLSIPFIYTGSPTSFMSTWRFDSEIGTFYVDNLCQGGRIFECSTPPVVDCGGSNFDSSNCNGGEAPLACYTSTSSPSGISFDASCSEPSNGLSYQWFADGVLVSTSSIYSIFPGDPSPSQLELVVENACGISTYISGSCTVDLCPGCSVNVLGPHFDVETDVVCEPNNNNPLEYNIQLPLPGDLGTGSASIEICESGSLLPFTGSFDYTFPSAGCYLICFEFDCDSPTVNDDPTNEALVFVTCPTRFCKTICIDDDPDCNDAPFVFCNDSGDDVIYDSTNPADNFLYPESTAGSIYDMHNMCSDTNDGCDNLNTFPSGTNFSNHEVIYYHQVSIDNDGKDLFFDLDSDAPVDHDIFVYRNCLSGDLSDCVVSSTRPLTGSRNEESIVIEDVQAFDEYYFVVDVQFTVNSSSGPYFASLTCGDLCDKIEPFTCGVIGQNLTTEDNTNEGSYYCGCEEVNGITRQDGLNWGPEDVYEFQVNTLSEVSIALNILDNNIDLELYLLRDTCDFKACQFSSRKDNINTNDPTELITKTLTPGTYYVVVEGYKGAEGNYDLLIDGCGEYCDDFPWIQNEDNPNLITFSNPNDYEVAYFTVAYPIDSIGNSNFTHFDSIGVDQGDELEYYCPDQGCYYICVWYESNNGGLESCCFKVCVTIPQYDCDFYYPVPIIVADDGTTVTCNFYCYSDPGDVFNIVDTSDPNFMDFITINGDTILLDDLGMTEEVDLPYGEYDICCWRYDPICHYWDVCCRKICFPYIPESEKCLDGFVGIALNPDNSFSYSPAAQGFDAVFTPPPASILCTTDLPSSSCSGTLNPGVHKVCYYDLTDGTLICCEHICIEENLEPPTDHCFDIVPYSDNSVILECTNNETVHKWTVWKTFDDPLIDDLFISCLYGNSPSIELQSGMDYLICKDFAGCCGETEQCCERICYIDPFQCNDIFWDYNGDTNNGTSVNYQFELDPNLVSEGYSVDQWQIDETGQVFGVDVTAASVDIPYDPDCRILTISATVVQTDADGNVICKYVCCKRIKIEPPLLCGQVVCNYMGDENDPYLYDISYNGNPSDIQQWNINGQEVQSSQLTGIDLSNYGNPGSDLFICVWIYDPAINSCRLCCFKLRLNPPYECEDFNYQLGQDEVIVSATGNFDGIYWQINNGPAISEGSPTLSIDPEDYPEDDFVWVYCFHRQPGTLCWTICCRKICLNSEENCEPTPDCYSNCCSDSDLTWLEDVKSILQGSCLDASCQNANINQASYLDQCIFVANYSTCLLDVFPIYYDCDGNELVNVDEALILNQVPIWNCLDGDFEECPNPCLAPKNLYCSDFEALTMGDHVSDLGEWSTPNGQVGCTVDTEGNGNNFMQVTGVFDPCESLYSIPTIPSQADPVSYCYRLNISDESGIAINFFDSNGVDIQMHFQSINNQGRINFRVNADQLTGDNAGNDYQNYNYPVNDWFDLRVVHSLMNDEVWIYINDIYFANVPNAGLNALEEILFSGALTGDTPVGVDDVCVKTCEDPDPECYNNCCSDSDLSWLEDEKQILLEICEVTMCTANFIEQGYYDGQCVYIIRQICTITTIEGTVVDCNGNDIGVIDSANGNTVDVSLLSNIKTIWDCANGDYEDCPNPCPEMVAPDCETFENYLENGLVSNQSSSWNIGFTGDDCRVQAEANGNLYLDVGIDANFVECSSIYTFPSTTSDVIKVSMDLNLSGIPIDNYNGLALEFTDGNNEYFQFNFQPGSFVIDQQIIYLAIQGDSINYNWPIGEWFTTEWVLDKILGEITISINGITIHKTSTSITDFGSVEFNGALSESAWIDNICISECNDCHPITMQDYELDCDLLQMGQFQPVENNVFISFFAQNGLNIQEWVVIDEATNTVISSVMQNSNNYGYDFEYGKSYIICFYYLDEDGCLKRCCIKLAIPETCNSINSTFSGDENNLTFQYNSVSNPGEEISAWWIDGLFAGDSDTLSYTYTVDGMYYICCLHYDPNTKCYRLCCRKVCIENPFECDNIDIGFDIQNENYILTAQGVSQVISWNIDIPIGLPNDGFIGSDNPQIFDPTDFGINFGDEIVVSVRYIDSDGCYKVCCERICVEEPLNCDDIIVYFSGNETDILTYNFSLDNATATNIQWILDNTGQNLGSTSEITVDFGQFGFNIGDEVTVTVRYFDPSSNCFRVCCKRICLEDPNAHCSTIEATGPVDSMIDLSSNFNGIWTIPGLDEIYAIGSDAIIDLNDPDLSSIITGQNEIFVCFTYFENGCCKICCIPVCLIESDLDCNLFEVSGTVNGNQFDFDLVDANTPTNSEIVVTLPDGSEQVLSGNQFSSAVEGDYTFIVEYVNPCMDTLQCAEELCMAFPLNCVDPTFSVNGTSVSFQHQIIGGASYLWDFGEGNTSADGSTNINHEFDLLGVYEVCLTVTGICGEICERCITVDLNNLDLEVEAEIINLGCNGNTGSIELIISGGLAPYEINWSDGSTNNPLVVGTAGIYGVTITDANGEDFIDSYEITNDQPSLDFSLFGNDCVFFEYESTGNPNEYNFTHGMPGGLTYEWDFGDGQISNDPGNTITHEFIGGLESYVVCLTVTNECGDGCTRCRTIFTNTDLQILGNVVDACGADSNGQINITISGGSMPYTINWSTGENSETISDLAEGVYTVTVEDSDGEEVSETFQIEMLTPQLEFPSDCIPFTWNYNSDSTGLILQHNMIGGLDYSWDFGNGDGSTDSNTTVEFNYGTNQGEFEVCLTVFNECGEECQQCETIVIGGENNPGNNGFFGPNMFTPNGDGINDFLEFVGIENFPENRLIIFNRWGKILLETTDYDNTWDGTHNGINLPDGTYYYILHYGVINDNENVLKSDLLIIRER